MIVLNFPEIDIQLKGKDETGILQLHLKALSHELPLCEAEPPLGRPNTPGI